MDFSWKYLERSNAIVLQMIKGSILFVALVVAIFLAGCAGPVVKTPSPIRATTRPYVIKNKVYIPQKHFELIQTGLASHYGGRDGCHGALTAMGERFNMFALTAAHKTLPLPSMILVENLENGKKLVVRVNDRGPYRGNRILDVSGAAARRLGFYHKGIAKVRIRTLVSESLKLKENQKNFCNRKRKKTRSCPVPNLSVQRYYVVVPAATLGKALSVKQALSEWGKTDLRKVYRGFHVMIGPYSTRLGAVQVQANLPKMYAARVLCFRRCPSMLLGVKRAKPHAKLHGVKTKSPQCKQVRRPLKRGKTGIRPGPAWVNA